MTDNNTLQALVKLKNVCKHFGEGDARVAALRDVSIEAHPGQVIGLLGPSGSGKSTLLNVIGCILEPSSGWLNLDGEVVFDNHWCYALTYESCGWKKLALFFSLII